MQWEAAKRLREQWGGKPCDHPHLTKEYYLGSQTGDWACNQCGASFDRSEVDHIRDARTVRRGAEAAEKLAAVLRADADAATPDAVKLAEAVIKMAESLDT